MTSSSPARQPIDGTSRDPQPSARHSNRSLRSPPPTLPINAYVDPTVELMNEFYNILCSLPEILGGLDETLDDTLQDKLMDRLKSKMADIDLLKVCRICVVRYKVAYDVFHMEPSLAEDVYRYFSVKMTPDDGKSSLLCHKCYLKIVMGRDEIKKSLANQFIYNFIWRKAREAKSTSTSMITNNPGNIIESTTSPPLMSKPQILPQISKNSIKNSKKETRSYKHRKCNNSCTFCNYQTINEQKELKSSALLDLCTKHSMPHTCLVPNCKLIFPNKELFITHYRHHLNLDRNTYLCHVCFGVLDCARNVKKVVHQKHVHQALEKVFKCCLNSYKTMGALVYHKYQNHRTKIIMTQSQCRSTYLDQTSVNSQLFTCLVAECDKVFDSCTHNLDHYTQHANISTDCHVCSICLNNYGEDRNTKLLCTHHNHSIVCNHCQLSFSSLHDLAVHKLCVHDSVILCGSNDIPGCASCSMIFEPNFISLREHYQLCYNKHNCAAEKPIGNIVDDTPQTSREVSLINNNEYNSSENSCEPMINEDIHGTYMCKRCNSYCTSLKDFINHKLLSHKLDSPLKVSDIKLCPLCDQNYPILHFEKHLEICIDTMRISCNSGDMTQRYGCAYCKSVIGPVSPRQFRAHYVFCKSFNSVIDGTRTYLKCSYCTFKSIDHLKCIEHANMYCIYFQLRMKYAMCPNEKQIVEQRTQLLQADSKAVNFSLLDFTPIVFNVELSSHNNIRNLKTIDCNSTNYKKLNIYNYSCSLCHKYFFDLFAFKHHLNNDGQLCRSRPLWYCKFCIMDFHSEDEYRDHVSDSKLDTIISCYLNNVNKQPTLKRQLQEESDESASEETDSNYDVNIAYKLLDLENNKPCFGFKIGETNKIKRKVDQIKSTLDMKLKN